MEVKGSTREPSFRLFCPDLTKLKDKLAEVPTQIPKYKFYSPAQAMPDQYKDPDPIKAYRSYLINEKHYAEWNKCTPKPDWWVKEVA